MDVGREEQRLEIYEKEILNQMDYLDSNRQSWNSRVEVHMSSPFYRLDEFRNGRSSLMETELRLLGDVSGRSILHLQCHFGQDTLSLARMGAHVTGVDLSDVAIDKARELAAELGLDASFINCDIYSLPEQLDKKFDIVYTSYGTIGWLPDIRRWAEVVSHFLKPGGKFVFVEFHPFVWMFDDDFTGIAYRYFNSGAIIESRTGTYADKQAPIEITDVSWNHGLGEVITALISGGLILKEFREYDYSHYDCFNHCVEYEKGRYRIQPMEDKIPLMYSILCQKPDHV